jgi:monofunctional biosynthetic peptidoglycan transglycosylase
VLVAALAPVLLLLPWRWFPPPSSSFMLQELAGLRPQAPGGELHYRWVPWDRISREAPIAFVAAEDQKFPDHRGFDLVAIGDALAAGDRGGSTISQQVVKNLLLWPGRSILRKGIEAGLTVYLELLWPKQRILEVYLNLAELGPGIYGVGAASQRLFQRSAGELDARQASLLAAVLPSPRRWSATRPGPYVEERARRIRSQVERLGGPAYLDGL